ncbi:Fanconi anemia group M protein [Thalassophryne amazonica]|uniref:Fanconi anemia group M protein n=1 Tax=Thalassophryne amazonica TaxID=390379 RepID=UPI001470B974|nr:Fanconi anemia group M protein [Thalassophryne amazonica]
MKMRSGSNQRTLFQTWGASVSQNKVAQPLNDGKKKVAVGTTAVSVKAPARRPPNSLWTLIGQGSTCTPEPEAADEDDDDDLMVVAVYEAEKALQCDDANFLNNDLPVETESSALSPVSYSDFPGFDSSAAQVWIYPTNYPIREYQMKMSEAALFQNTLVCLPTGLGKTFIASVVMYNFYRWYPSGKIVFIAPTKPLVAQQIEACYNVMGIPQTHMAELTGSTAAKHRQEVWKSKRVFFLTPQVMVNDLSRDTCPAKQVKCVVIDEAHKALGNHAYCQVVRQLGSQTRQFRVLALSATPGGDTKSVQSVISNLLISHIELRSEDSPDIQAHSHQRSVEKVVVPLGDELIAHQARYLQVLEKFMGRLVQNRVMAHKDLRSLTKYQLILARDQFRKNPLPHIKAGPQQGMLEGDFAICISLYHGYELLMQMGLRSLFFYVQSIMDGSREMSRARNELQRTPNFMDLYHEMEAMFMKPSAGPDEPFIYSHPKLKKLEEVVLQHFRFWTESSADSNGSDPAVGSRPKEVSTRVMIFSSFRESVQEIAAMLNCHAPLIRVMTFMGQASAGKGVKGFTQKEQLEVVHRFRQGGFNTLVSTCVGEEGLDIGEVDLIVCFDAQKNPIRLVQRMGRTGRKRQGRIVVILAEGREERTYNQSQSNKRSVYKSIISNTSGFHMYPNSPRMLPDAFNPSLHKMHITCGQFDHRESSRRSVRGRRSHSERRNSLIHPQNLIQHGIGSSDGFLSNTEYSIWESTMKLDESEVHSVLQQSHFVSLPNDLPSENQEASTSGRPCRQLSLWEWRLWQNKALPTHLVDHSVRCQHFIKVMELIDHMRDENEGVCRYEQELLPYFHKVTTVSNTKNGHVDRRRQKAAKKKTRENKLGRRFMSSPDLDFIDKEGERETEVGSLRHSSAERPVTGKDDTETFCPLTSNHECSVVPDGDDNDCVVVSEEAVRAAEEQVSLDKDVELQALFYLPEWDSAPSSSRKLPSQRHNQEALRNILANVEELLARCPPPLPEDIRELLHGSDPAVPQHTEQDMTPRQPFQVSFTLDMEDDEMIMEDDEMIMSDATKANEPPAAEWDNVICLQVSPAKSLPVSEPQASGDDILPTSPTWEDIFEDKLPNDENIREDCLNMDTRHDDLREEGNAADKSRRMNSGEEEKSKNEIPEEDDRDSQYSRGADVSMDLFGDDEAFLQVNIPDIPTPEHAVTSRTSPDVRDIADSSPKTLKTSPVDTAITKQRCDSVHSNTSPRYTTGSDPRTALATDMASTSYCSSPPMPYNSLHNYFTVNFDLGYSLEDSEEESEGEVVPAQCTSTTPNNSLCRWRTSTTFRESKLSTPQPLLERGGRHGTSVLTSPVILPSPIASPGVRPVLVPGPSRARTPSSLSSLKRKRAESVAAEGASSVETVPPRTAEVDTDSDEEVGVIQKRYRSKVNPLSSPDVSKISSNVESPLLANKTPAAALNKSDETEGEAASDDDFQNDSRITACGPQRQKVQREKSKHAVHQRGRQFLDEEAELSEEAGLEVSSDEDDSEQQSCSLKGFVVDSTHFSQGLNDSEMQGFYLKSVRSPAVPGKFKMSFRKHHNMDIFSQVPEMDETYAEDSFVVGSEVESNEEDVEEENIELMPEDSYVDGRRQYATRRRVFLHKNRTKARAGAKTEMETSNKVKTKQSRIIRITDSSEEETEDSEKRLEKERDVADPFWQETVQQDYERSEVQHKLNAPSSSSSSATLASKVSLLSRGPRGSATGEQHSERCRQRLENQHVLSEQFDFMELPAMKQPQKVSEQDLPASERRPSSGPVSIMVDSRCLSSGAELMTSLRQRHAATVHVCSLDGSYFIVSNRMAVERHSQSDLAAMHNRKRLADRLSSLQGLFERVCLIVEKDRIKSGEVSRPFQRTRCYDSILAALVHNGVRLLWSNSPEESAGLLADLAQLEQRKGQGITVPLEVKGQHQQQTLNLYLSIPSVSYVQALNMTHNFRSISHLINSSVESIQKGSHMSRSRAEEVFRFLRYSCDSFLINTSTAGKNS